MNITPMTKLNSLNELNKVAENANSTQIDEGGLQPFKEVFEDAINNYKDSEDRVSKDIYDISVGNSDDLHNLMINMKKADMSLDIFLQLRNKALDAYKELMGINM